MVSYTWPAVLHLPIYTTLRMAWLFCRSWQIWSHILGDLCLSWTVSPFIECVPPGLSYLVYAPRRHMEWVATYPWPVVSGNNTHNHDGGVVLLHILPNLVPQLGCSMAWMDGMSVHWLCHRLVKSCTCARNTGGTDGKTSIAYGFIQQHTPLWGWHGGFADPTKYGPTA